MRPRNRRQFRCARLSPVAMPKTPVVMRRGTAPGTHRPRAWARRRARAASPCPLRGRRSAPAGAAARRGTARCATAAPARPPAGSLFSLRAAVEPVLQRIGFRLGRMHRDVGGDARQELVAGDEHVRLGTPQAGMLRRMAVAADDAPGAAADRDRIALDDAADRRWAACRRRGRSRRNARGSSRAAPRETRRRDRSARPRCGASCPVSATRLRHIRNSVRVIHSSTSNLRTSQPASPIWSGCMWVTITRLTGRPPIGPAKSCSQACAVSSLRMPLSTTVQPSPSSSSHRLMWLSCIGRRMRTQWTPGATSMVSPSSGRVSNG